MKKIKLLLLIAIACCAFSCEKKESFSLEGTEWTKSDIFEDEEYGQVVKDHVLVFEHSTAIYRLMETYKVDNAQTVTNKLEHVYDYMYSDDFVVLTPQEANLAHLEGTITSGIKMVLVNTSMEDGDNVIGTFYRKD